MFKNFDKVFKFTFKNQTSTKSYIRGTFLTAFLLFVIPVAIFLIVGFVMKGDDDELKSCGADRVYVVDPEAPNADFNTLNLTGVEGYTDIQYSNAETVDAALETIETRGETKAIILQIRKEDGRLQSRIILPESSELEKDEVKNYNDFIDESGNVFALIASGVNMNDMTEAMKQTDYSVYDTEGYKSGTDLYTDSAKLSEQQNSEILPVFNMVLTYVCVIFIYMIIILYGNSILQNIVLEKSSKLMDTMLISVSPQSLIFGKMLAILTSGILQLLVWIAGLVGGVVVGIKIFGSMFDGVNVAIVTFIKSFSELGLFKPVNVIVGILALIFGIIMYASLSAVAGSISSSREEAASNQGIFIFLLLISFYAILFKGMNTTNPVTWLYLLPFTSAMVLPSGICSGVISTGLAAAGLAILVVCSVVFIILAGKLYKMMSLYKGNKVSISKALKMLAGK
ncbi:ABC-type Na+ efflux pump, permease component [Lachnospiraceae bacterium NE2001]|nr:ABC-type Na+ efflux pump, permease component [Lachnospiraceae bacterium NE2001]